MTARRVGIEVEGLREFRAELKRLDEDGYWRKSLVKAEKAVAASVG